MRIFCPGCSTEVEPDAVKCPICERPRSREEMFAALSGPPKARTRWRGLVFAALGAGVFGWSLEKYSTWTPPWLTPEPLTEARTEVVPAAGEDAGPVSAEPRPSDGPIGEPVAPAAPRRPRSTHWTVRGRAYDLETLDPVAGLSLEFTEKLGESVVRARTDSKGRYAVRLPRIDEGGYLLRLKHKAYPDYYLEEASTPFRDLPVAARREALVEARQAKVLHVPLLPPSQGEATEYDLVLPPPR